MKALAPGDLIAGKFRLERLVGRGGMGSVWAARQEQLGMLVALKFVEAPDGADLEDAHARFEREAKAAAQIRSPHVAQIIDHGLDGDRPFIAMELLDGEDLGDRLRREGRISVAAAAKILTQASKALRRAHEAGIVHRDLKPGNIFLARFDDDEVVKLLDFGVAKVRSTGALDGPLATQAGVVFGSPSYMSPEQARGARTLDHRSDLWSLAVIVFRAITGVKPFQAASIGDLVVKLCIDPLPVPSAIAPDLPPEIDRFFERAFARDPQQRFASVVEMAAAFERIAAAAPALAASSSAHAPPSVSPISTGPRPLPVPAAEWPMTTPVPAERMPASWLPPVPPLSAPVVSAPPVAATPGSGPHVAFAAGTLTPPPGSAALVEPIPVAAGPSFEAAAPELARPTEPAAPPPSARITPAPIAPAWAPRTVRAAGPPKAAIGIAVAVAALLSLGAWLLVGARSGAPRAAATAPAASASMAPSPEPAPSVEPAPSASAPPAASASAEPAADPDPSARPAASARAPAKPGKRRPNFGY